MPRTIYWDYNATAPIRPKVRERVIEALDNISGNPSSVHEAGQKARAYIESVRRFAAQKLKLQAHELIFCGSATEANFMVLWGTLLRRREKKGLKKILSSSVEHSSMIKNIRFLCEQEGVELVEIPFTAEGKVDLVAVEKLLQTQEFWLCSLFAACNESGILYPWKELSLLCDKYQVPFHCDMVQLLGREHFSLEDSKLSSATFAFHKSGGLKGSALLYMSSRLPWVPVIHGGGQEKKRRSGTENILAIAGVQGIFEEIDDLVEIYQSNVKKVRDAFELELKKNFPQVKIVGETLGRLPNTSFVIFQDIPSDLILMALDVRGVCASSGSACSSGLSEASSGLMKLGYSAKEAASAVRFSLGESARMEDISVVIQALKEMIEQHRRSA